jgi:hypothetical protein
MKKGDVVVIILDELQLVLEEYSKKGRGGHDR